MKSGKRKIISGLIALAVSIAVLLGLQAVDRSLPTPAAAPASGTDMAGGLLGLRRRGWGSGLLGRSRKGRARPHAHLAAVG